MAFNYSPKIVTDGLVLYLDAANPNSYVSGSTSWNDISRGGNNGTLVNGPIFNAGNGGSIVFDGVNDYVGCKNNISLNVGNNITVLSWFYVNSTITYQPIIAKTLNNNGWELSNNSGTLRCTLRPSIAGSNNVISGTLNNNKWYHASFTFNGSNIILYLNGLQTGLTIANSVTLDTSNDLFIGRRNDGININYFNGNISQTTIYNRALSSQEVLQNYNATKTRFGLI